MNEFKGYHPIVNLTYFVFVIGLACIFLHPVCLVISFLSAVSYLWILKGRQSVVRSFKLVLPMVIFMAVINPAFNHRGETIICYFPSGNPLTFESLLYGVVASFMIATVIYWFSCYNSVMTSDKFIYLFGKIIPSLSLVISMTLRFVPRFSSQLKVVVNAQRCMGRDIREGSVIKRIKTGVCILSVMITWALENAIETADSMKARGYGLKGRTAYSVFRFDKRDMKALSVILFLGVYVIAGGLLGKMEFVYFPSIRWAGITPYGISLFFAYFMLCIFPVAIEMWEVRKWNALRSKI